MAILLFIVAGIAGFGLTIFTLRYAMRHSSLTHHGYALILAIGFGATWMVAFFAPFFAPGDMIQLKLSLILFFMGHSVIVAIMTYVTVRVGFMLRSKHHK